MKTDRQKIEMFLFFVMSFLFLIWIMFNSFYKDYFKQTTQNDKIGECVYRNKVATCLIKEDGKEISIKLIDPIILHRFEIEGKLHIVIGEDE